MKKLLTAITILLLLFASISIQTTDAKSETTPTLLLHGFMGSKSTFLHTAEVFQENKRGNFERVYSVSPKGKIKVEKVNKPSKGKSPIIIVEFENNTASLADQTKWLASVIKSVKSTYKVKHVNIVGHSMGGVTAINYILTNKLKGQDIKKLVTVDSPILGANTEFFNQIQTGLAQMVAYGVIEPNIYEDLQKAIETPAYHDLTSKLLESLANNKKYKGKFPKHIKALSISVKQSEVVSTSSAYGLKLYTNSKTKKNVTYKEMEYSGESIMDLLKDPLNALKFAKGLKDLEEITSFTRHSGVLTLTETDEELMSFLFK
ncbi:alpha/beta hydrolase [Bacillus sp. 31A1R]|uniref:Alpha/beta hydrolase n=1 Tax=Robertmurraya mangrovi TaxID=3098077 RepID=A0ABU5J1A9_9BACI|nr:alpha/beta fold hydrolase [Bacillus sp. 31A1R]MDZ5473162.1 alpha/beta hydrolase [Bacillus sp. 31A1R]